MRTIQDILRDIAKNRQQEAKLYNELIKAIASLEQSKDDTETIDTESKDDTESKESKDDTESLSDCDTEPLSDCDTESLSDDDTESLSDNDEDELSEDILSTKSTTELKEIYKTVCGKSAGGRYANKSEWLIKRILENSDRESKPKKKSDKKKSDKKKSDKKKSKKKKKSKDKTTDILDETDIDDDLDQLVYDGVEYDLTKVPDDGTWILKDGERVGTIKTYDSHKVILMYYEYEGIQYEIGKAVKGSDEISAFREGTLIGIYDNECIHFNSDEDGQTAKSYHYFNKK